MLERETLLRIFTILYCEDYNKESIVKVRGINKEMREIVTCILPQRIMFSGTIELYVDEQNNVASGAITGYLDIQPPCLDKVQSDITGCYNGEYGISGIYERGCIRLRLLWCGNYFDDDDELDDDEVDAYISVEVTNVNVIIAAWKSFEGKVSLILRGSYYDNNIVSEDLSDGDAMLCLQYAQKPLPEETVC